MNRLEGRGGLSWGWGRTPDSAGWGAEDLLLDLLQDVSHLAEEVLCGEAVVTAGPGATAHTATTSGGQRCRPREATAGVGGAQSPAVPSSHSQAEGGVVGPHEAQGTARTLDPGRVPPSSWLAPARRVSPPSRVPAVSLDPPANQAVLGAAKGSTGRLMAGQLTRDKPGLGFGGQGWHRDVPGPEPKSSTWAFWATSSTSWNFSDTVKSSFGGSCNHRGERIATTV